MRFGQIWFHGSLKRVLLLMLVTSLVLTVLLLAGFSSVYQRMLNRNTQQSIDLYASEQQKLLEDELQVIKTALYSLANKQEIEDYMNAGKGYKASKVHYITSLLSDVHDYVSYISDVTLATPDQRVVAMTYNKGDMSNFKLRYAIINQYYAQGETGLKWYTMPPAEGGFMLALVVPIQSAAQTGIAVAFSTAEDLFGGLSLSESPCFLFADAGEIWRAASAQALPIPEKIDTHNGWARFSIAMTGWEMLLQYPLRTVGRPMLEMMLRWSSIATLVFLLIECILIWAIYRAIIAPIISISTQTTHIESSTAQIDNPAPGRHELSMLVHNINAMVARTNQLTLEISAAQTRMMEMDIRHLKERNMFLQVQINPHFLYNMLECICGMAAREGNEDIREMTHLMSRLYQYCLQSPESTLGQELECVALYAQIIQRRYREGYRIDVDIPEDYALLPMPRMVLEPIVENAIQHGFVRGTDQIFFVSISARLIENVLELRIADNGCAMPEFRPIAGRPLTAKVQLHPETMKRVYREMLDEAGVETILYAHMTDAVVDGDRIAALLVHCLEGPGLFFADQFIDATGDAILFREAGAPVRKYASEDGMHKSMFFFVGGVTPFDHETACAVYREAYAAGRLPEKVWNHFGYSIQLNPGVVQIAVCFAEGDALDSRDMSRMDREMREHVFAIVDFLRREMPGFANCYLLETATHIGVRMAQGIVGKDTLTEKAIVQGIVDHEPVALTSRSFGAHGNGAKHFNATWSQHLDGFGAVPMGALVSPALRNALTAGRCISSEPRVIGTFRMMNTCMTLGEAAGLMASLSGAQGGDVRTLPYSALRPALDAAGFLLGEKAV